MKKLFLGMCYLLLISPMPMMAQVKQPANAKDSSKQQEKKQPPTERPVLFLQPVEITALRAGDKSPFAKTNLSKKDIEKQNLGQDLPFLLNLTPSMVVTSDAGNGVGYTGMRIRGTDGTRINVTMNGIPYNDPESQISFFVDMPDIASSLNSIQIQRGVGTSSNGAGAFGASVNISTNEFNPNAYAEINNTYGSFNTWKHTVKAGSGLINNHFTIDARLSKISSDGFIDRGSSNLKSLYLSGAYYSPKSSIRFNLISGTEKTYQAWGGIPQYKLFYDKDSLLTHYYNNLGTLYFTEADSINLFDANARTYNGFLYKNQTDNFQQDHYQLFFNHSFTDKLSFNSAVFLTKGKGYYEEYKNDAKYSSYGLPNNGSITKTDLIRQLFLENNYYGFIFSLQYKKLLDEITVGGAANQFDNQHYGFINWAQNGGIPKDYRYYYFPANKKDANIYAKWQHKFTANLQGFLDLQYRFVNYNINGSRKFADLYVNNQFHFFNPKIGLTYSKNNYTAYASFAVANKEPNRNDYEVGSIQPQPKPEQLQDWELGFEKRTTQYSWGANLYYMNYKDQLALTGKINDVGDAVRINVPKSYRAGVELQGAYQLDNKLRVGGNLTLSQNKIKNFVDNIPNYDVNFDLIQQDTFYYKETTMALSPAVTGAATVEYFPFKNALVALYNKYVGKQYLDNTERESKKINGYYAADFRLGYTIQTKLVKQIDLIFQVNNVWDKKFESNGYTYSYIYDKSTVVENFYFPMAGRNFMVSVMFKL